MKEPFLRRLWSAIQPPPPARRSAQGLNRGQQRLLGGATLVLLLLLSGWGLYAYVASAPGRANAAFEDGLRSASPGRYREAVARFTHAIRIWPQHSRAYMQRGLAYQALNQPDAAEKDFETASLLEPGLAEAQTALGTIYRERGDDTRAIQAFSRSIELGPTAEGYYQRGQVYESLHQFQKALDDYDQAIGSRRDAPFLYRSRAAVRREMGDFAGADQDMWAAAAAAR